MRTAFATCLALLTAIMTNYATQIGPAWTRVPEVVWSVAFVLATFTVAATVRDHSTTPAKRERLREVRLYSLRVPALDAPFRGRADELARLRLLLHDPAGKFVVICGPGGAGKTTLAAKLAAETKGRVRWVRFHDRYSFVSQLADVTRTFDGVRGSSSSTPDRLWEALGKEKRWLLVFDNIDSPNEICIANEPLFEYRGWVRPEGPGLLVITSSVASQEVWGDRAILVEVESLDTGAATSVLLDVAPGAGSREDAAAVAERLAGFPLGLRAVGKALSQPTARLRTFADYLAALRVDLADTLAPEHGHELTNDQKRRLLRYTWELSLDQLKEEGRPLARSLLRMLSLTADAPFPRYLVVPKLLNSVLADDLPRTAVDGALDGLHRHGLVTMQDGPIPSVMMHPLVRDISRVWLNDEADVELWFVSLDLVLLAEVKKIRRHAFWDRGYVLLPHFIEIPTRLKHQYYDVAKVQRQLRQLSSMLRGAALTPSHMRLASQLDEAVDARTHRMPPKAKRRQLPE